MDILTKDDIVRGLRRLDRIALESGMLIELSVYGGAALAIAFDVRNATRDVDAVVNGDPVFLRESAIKVAEEEGWPVDWLNDGVKGFISQNEAMVLMNDFKAAEEGGLRVFVPTPEYLFAMKCMAMRSGQDGSHDIEDIKSLAEIARITSHEAALNLIESFYPARVISAKTRFGVEEIMQQIRDEKTTKIAVQKPN